MERTKKHDREERKELDVLRKAVESTNEGFVTIDEAHRVLFFNRAAERIFGYRRDEVVGRDLNVILAPECTPEHRQAVVRYLEAKRPRPIGHATELTARRKDGSTFPCYISFSVARRKGKVFFTGIVRDLTRTKVLQAQVVEAERLAALGQTVAEIIHEIRNPMVIIGGFLRQMIRQSKEPGSLSKLEIMASEVRRVENLLGELRDLYLPRTLKRRTLDLNRLLEEVTTLAGQAASRKNVRLSLERADGPVFVRGDREKLKQVFLNIIKNGIEAAGEGGNTAIRAKVRDGQVEVRVTDDGPGIPSHLLPKVFSPFFTTKKEGTGLGLCISRRIMDEHRDGSLELTTGEGKGTIVRIRLPLRAPRSVKADTGRAARALPKSRGGA